MQAMRGPSGMLSTPPTGSISHFGAASIGLVRANENALGSLRPFDVECVGAGDPNIDLVTFREAHDLDDFGRQPNGKLVTPLFDFHRTLLDSTHVHLGG